jgi:hypothetical protein
VDALVAIRQGNNGGYSFHDLARPLKVSAYPVNLAPDHASASDAMVLCLKESGFASYALKPG